MKKIMVGVVVIVMSAGWPSSAQQQMLPDCPELSRALQDLVRADARARDFANLRRYRELNVAVKPGQSRVVLMGDSITDNWSQPQYGGGFSGHTTVIPRAERAAGPAER